VSIARRRMIGRPIELSGYNATQLRADALKLVKGAWHSKILVPEAKYERGLDDDVVVSTECYEVKGTEHGKRNNLDKEGPNYDLCSGSRKRKREAAEIPMTRTKVRAIDLRFT
jgi:hypothetical protein